MIYCDEKLAPPPLPPKEQGEQSPRSPRIPESNWKVHKYN